MYKRHRGFSEMSNTFQLESQRRQNKNFKDAVFEDIVVKNYQNFAK